MSGIQSRAEYYDEIHRIAEDVKAEIQEWGKRSDIYEQVVLTCDSHQWSIYTAYHLDVLRWSDNEEYGVEEGLIDPAHAIKEGGVQGLLGELACCAMVGDVLEELSDWDPEEEEEEA